MEKLGLVIAEAIQRALATDPLNTTDMRFEGTIHLDEQGQTIVVKWQNRELRMSTIFSSPPDLRPS